jgi:tetratricopeptide (TPR) repeat protein
MDLCLAAYQLKPGRIDILDTMAWIQYHKGNNDQALMLLEKINDQVGSHPMYNYHLSLALLKSGEEKEALSKLESALKSQANFHGRTQAEKTLKELRTKGSYQTSS